MARTAKSAEPTTKEIVRATLTDAFHEKRDNDPSFKSAVSPGQITGYVDKYEPVVSAILKQIGIFAPEGVKVFTLAFAELLDQGKAIADKYAPVEPA